MNCDSCRFKGILSRRKEYILKAYIGISSKVHLKHRFITGDGKMQIKVFIKNTVVLVATSIVLRSVGIVFRVYLADKIGSDGIGLYQLIFSVYMLAATFATTGISTAVTRLVAENAEKGGGAVKKIMLTSFALTLAAAVASSAAVYVFSRQIAVYWIKDESAAAALKILSFSLPFMGLSSCIRGYFIACRKALQPSAVQLFEQAVRIAVIFFCLSRTAGQGIATSATAVLFGDTVAEVASCLLHFALYRLDFQELGRGGRASGVLKEIIRISLPLAGVGYMSTALHTAENLLVPTRLTYFYGERSRGLELYGAIRGMAMPILFFPASFLTSFSTMLIPEVSEAKSVGRKDEVRSTVNASLTVTLSLSVLVGSVFLFWAEDIANVIYRNEDVGYIIRVLSPIVPFMYMESVAAGILKGLDRQLSMFGYNTVDSVLRIVSVIIVLPIFGINGYLIIMAVSNCLTSSLCCRKLLKTAEVTLDIKNGIIIPLVISLIGGFLGGLLFGRIKNIYPRLILGVGVQVSVFALAFFTKRHSVLTVLKNR